MREKCVNKKSSMIDEEDLKRKDHSLQQLVFLELDFFMYVAINSKGGDFWKHEC